MSDYALRAFRRALQGSVLEELYRQTGYSCVCFCSTAEEIATVAFYRSLMMVPAAICTAVTASYWSANLTAATNDELTRAVLVVQRIRSEGEAHRDAQAAWQILNQATPNQLPVVLAGILPRAPLSNNWIRAAVDSIAERSMAAGSGLPAPQLEAFVLDRQFAPLARRLAFEWLVKVDPSAEARLIPQMADDPSLELRRDGVALLLADAARFSDNQDTAAAQEKFQAALTAARDQDQIEAAAAGLEKLGVTVSLPRHYGFLLTWQLIGPFDNRNKIGFDQEYAPEKSVELTAELAGKEGPLKWKEHTTNDKFGLVDLNEALGKNMGAVGYAYTVFATKQPCAVDIRLGCINANKVWVNGKLLIANHVYHAGTSIDQYVAQADLQAGENTILVKICQNEQTDSWAQDWRFQLRVCDTIGTAILSER